MMKLKVFSSLISLALVLGLMACVTPAEKSFDEQLASQLQAVLDDAVESSETQFPGALLHVSSAELGTWSGAAGLGNIETDTAMRADDMYPACSIVKIFVSVATLQLVEEGLFALDDTLPALLPENVTARFANSNRITVRMLLNHTSGLGNWNEAVMGEALANPTKVWETDEVLDIAAAQDPNFAPGESWAYSNTGYFLLHLIIEQATGQSYREEIRERIINKLNMENTAMPEPGDPSYPGNYFHSYFFYGGEVYDLSEVDASMARALVSTSADLARFLDAVMSGELFQNSETLDEMLTLVEPPEGAVPWGEATSYGLGMMKLVFPGGIEMFGHTGDIPNSTFVFYLPAQDITISGAHNSYDPLGLYYQVVIPALEILVPGLEPAEPVSQQIPPAGNVYQDPEGRFSMTLVGEWTPVETDGTYAQFAYADMPLYMSIVTVETDDLEVGVDAALRQVGIDPTELTETKRSPWDKWTVFYYTLGDGQGVTVVGQTSDGTSYLIVATGDEALTTRPPEDIMKTIEGFSLSGKVSLPTTVEAFETYVNSFFETLPSGLSMAIALEEDVLYKQGFGMADGPRGIPATPNTVYGWGSVTKTVTATAIMQLREQGLIDLDAPVSDYLDYFPAQYPITVRHLLTHSSGLPEPAGFVMVNLRLKGQPLPDFDLVVRKLVEGVSELMFEPGSQSAYCNTNYMTLGQVVAAVSGQPYDEYVMEHIINPLGMTNTDFTYSNDFMEANVAAPAVPVAEAEAIITLMDEARGLGDGADFFRETVGAYAWMNPYIVGESAGGGLMGPATDMIRFAQMMLNEGELDGVRILAAESVALLQEVQTSTSDEPLGIGLAWFLGGDTEHPYIEHDGGGAGLQAKLRIYMKDGFAIAILANGAGLDRSELADAAANVVFSMLGR